MKNSLLILFLLVLAGCASQTQTPLAENQIKDLTSCKITLNQARKNLLMNGYEVLNLTEDSFNTDFKMATDERITALAGNPLVDFRKKFIVLAQDGKVQFKVRYQIIKYGTRVGSTQEGYSTTGNIGQALSETDADAEYYVENQKLHEKTKKQICGN